MAGGSSTQIPYVRDPDVQLMLRARDDDEDAFLQGLLSEEPSPTIARARIDSTIQFLINVKRKLSETE